MFFLGSGALMTMAMKQCVEYDIAIDGICCPIEDRSVNKYKKYSKNIILTDNPNSRRKNIENLCKDGIVFSINNKHILTNELLRSNLRFYNIHNGLVQQFRGIAEVCIFAALCRNFEVYGVSLQRLLPGEVVDGGPVIDQISMPISKNDDFEKVFSESLVLCNEIFKLNIIKILTDSTKQNYVKIASKIYRYKDMPNLIRNSSADCLKRAKSLGHYAALLPRLNEAIRNISQ